MAYNPADFELVDAPTGSAPPYNPADFDLVSEPEGSGFWRQAADLPVSAMGGVVTGLKGMSDVFGANNPVSQELGSYQQFYNQALSPEAQADQQEVARIMQEAQDKGMWEQIKAGGRAFATAPLDTMAQSLGTMAPIVATGVAGKAFGLGARGVQIAQAAAGSGMQAGTVKDEIYQNTKQFLMQRGKSEEEADRVALEAQSYGGQNLDQILLGAGLGALDAVSGVESILGKTISKTGREVTGGVIVNALKTGVKEAIPEALQGGQEPLAKNIALQRQGYDVPTMRGVLAQGTMEGLAGFAAGAPVGAAEGFGGGYDPERPVINVAPPAPAFAPPPAAATVDVQEAFGDPTTAAAEPAATQPAASSYNPDDFEPVVEEQSAPIVTEPPAAPAFQFNLADDTATAPQVDAGADVFSGVQGQAGASPAVRPAFQFDLADDTATAPEMDAVADVFAGMPQQQAPVVAQEPEIVAPVESPVDAAREPAAQPQLATAQAAPSSFAQAFRTAKSTEDKRLAVLKAVANGTIVSSVVEAAESGKPLPSIEKFKDAFPYEGVALPGRVDLSKVAIKPIKPAEAQQAAKSHASDDPNRFVLNGVFHDADAQMVVATDGRRLVAIPKKIDGNSRIARLDTKGSLGDKDIDGGFPKWRQVVPTFNRTFALHSIDIDKARRAGTVLAGINKTVGKLAASPAKVMIGGALLDPSYVKDAVEALVASGAKTIRAASAPATWEKGQVLSEAVVASPILLRGDNGALAVIMPIQSKKNDLVVDVSTVIPERVGNEWLETIQMFEAGNPDTPAKRSRRRIKNMTAQSGAIDLSIVEDLVEYGKTIYRAGMSFGKWAGQMVKEFGQGIASFLKQAFDRIVQAYKDSPYSDTTGAVGNVQPKMKPRQFEEKAKKSDAVTEEAKAELGSEYEMLPHRQLAGQAKEYLAKNGIEAAERRILELNSDDIVPTPLDFAVGLELTGNLSATGQHSRAAAVVRTMSRRATSLGQTISTLAMLSRLTPEGIVFYANQLIDQHIDQMPESIKTRVRQSQDQVAEIEKGVSEDRMNVANTTILEGQHGGEKIATKIRRRVPDKGKGQGALTSVRSVLMGKATKAEAIKQIAEILQGSGISPSEAQSLANTIADRFYKVIEEARKGRAAALKPKSGKARISFDKLMLQLNDGKVSDEDFVSTLSVIAGVPAMTPEMRKQWQELARQYQEATDPDVKMVLAGRIFEEAHSILPADFWSKLRAVSYLAMLFAPRTWIRNLGGNQIQFIANIGADTIINAVVDPAVSIFTGRRSTSGVYVGKRFAALLTPIWDVKKGYEWNKKQNPQASFKDNLKAGVEHLRVLSKLTTQNKFDITDVKDVGRRMFSSKFMRFWDSGLSIALGGGDRGFWMAGFRASLAQQEAAAKENNEWTGMATPEMIETAFAEAAYAIYQNPNFISKGLNEIRKGLNWIFSAGKTTQFGVGTSLLAFTQVPGSIFLRAFVDWSPLGMIPTLYQAMNGILYGKSNGRYGAKFDQRAFNKAFTQSLLGSGVYATGYWLYAMGIITASREDDDDLEAMRKSLGGGGYRVNVSALKRMLLSGNFFERQETDEGDFISTYDWAQPMAIAVAAGAEYASQSERASRDGLRKRLAGREGMLAISLKAGAKSLEEQPLLSGLSSFMRTWGYSGPLEAVYGTVANIPGMFVPQLWRQLSQLQDNTARETRGDRGMTKAFMQIASQTLFAQDVAPPRFDILGQAQERYQYGGNTILNVMANPGMVSRAKNVPALAEVSRLMNVTGETRQIPRMVERTADINGQSVELTNDQISAYQYYLGNYTMSMFNWRMASPKYARLPDIEKVKLLAQDLEDVNASTKSYLFGHDVQRLTRRQRSMRANLANSPLGQSMPPR